VSQEKEKSSHKFSLKKIKSVSRNGKVVSVAVLGKELKLS
jgi:hypothetical protein